MNPDYRESGETLKFYEVDTGQFLDEDEVISVMGLYYVAKQIHEQLNLKDGMLVFSFSDSVDE